jgi:hypothetical protein
LILTTLHQGNINTVAPFVRSLKRTDFRGQIIMFTSRVSSESQDALRQNKVVVVPFHFSGKRDRQQLARLWPLWRWYFASGASPTAKAKLAHRVFHLRYRRYLLYEDFLRQHGSDYDRVLLADSRDIFFQTDPFAWDWSPGVHCFLEEPANRIGQCRLHRLWLGCQFGQEFVEQHADKTVSCSGTTFGDTPGVIDYVNQMVATIMKARNLAKISGGDQGIHNYLLIENRLPNITIHENRRSPVMTMGTMRMEQVRLNQDGLVINENGQIVPVLHQYDRISELKNQLLAYLPQN